MTPLYLLFISDEYLVCFYCINFTTFTTLLLTALSFRWGFLRSGVGSAGAANHAVLNRTINYGELRSTINAKGARVFGAVVPHRFELRERILCYCFPMTCDHVTLKHASDSYVTPDASRRSSKECRRHTNCKFSFLIGYSCWGGGIE
ncbi:hypothetical protein Zmor_027836 [Zophobas morio]|uniref:Uncharacterized protein n=1 Tax=Zophobas morio TaxID=2755281 RepID=A0AA38HU78_9CUCU|nr:hypothetical protein Zmor_027836 [Zophobas morio]